MSTAKPSALGGSGGLAASGGGRAAFTGDAAAGPAATTGTATSGTFRRTAGPPTASRSPVAGGGGVATTTPRMTGSMDMSIMMAQVPLVGPDGKPINLGDMDWHLSEAKLNKHFTQLQQNNLEEVDKLNAKLRKEYDQAKMLNKRKQKELQQVTAELMQLERVAGDRSGAAVASSTSKDPLTEVELRMQSVHEMCGSSTHQTNMYEFMMTRLRDETKELEMRIDQLGKQLKSQQAEQESTSLALHQSQAQKTRSVALVHTLTRHLELGRAQRAAKMSRVEMTFAGQEARLKAFDARERRRVNMSSMPRGDLDEEGEDRLKQLFLVRKIYNNMLSRRLRDDQRRTDRLALAFQRIRTATGLSDVDAIISKYEQRDATVLALQAQMKAARDRVDALAAERKQLVWALDEVQTLSASALESRALYNSVEERDRRLADAAKQARESRDRLHRVGLTVEACRACIVNMLERLGQDATFLNGVVAGTTATGTPSSGTRATPARRGSASSSPLRTTSPAGVPPTTADEEAAAAGDKAHASVSPLRLSVAGGDVGSSASSALGVVADSGLGAAADFTATVGTGAAGRGAGADVVYPEQLESGLLLLEQRLAQMLAHLASVFEREEAAMATSAKSKTKVRRGAAPPGSAASTLPGSSSASRSPSGAPALDATLGTVTESDTAAHRASVAVLSDKASNRIFQRMMTMQPDMSDANVRINARSSSPDAQRPALLLALTSSGSASARGLPGSLQDASGGGGGGVSPTLSAGAGGPLAGGGGGGGGGAAASGSSSNDASAAVNRGAAELGKLLHGASAGAVVDRVALKRLSAMVAASMQSVGAPPSSGGGGASKPAGGR